MRMGELEMLQGCGEQRGIQGFGGEIEEMRPLGSPRHKWKYNVKKYFK
jgi:hypothetical protein